VADRPTSFGYLPPGVAALLPEMETGDWPSETHADCNNCPMVKGKFGTWDFRHDTRCCTAQPSLANFLVGRALRRGGISREKVLARLEDLDGVTAWGVDAPAAIDQRYTDEAAFSFGRDHSLRCPYWIGEPNTCGIWHDRSSTCRTWYCKHEDGLAGAVAWSRMQAALFELESRLALWAIGEGDPPEDEGTPATWALWFEQSAALVDAIDPADIKALDTATLHRVRKELSGFVDVRRVRRGKPLADVLVPAVTEMANQPDGTVLLTGYSSFDAVRAPIAVFELLARLDGRRTWRQALDATRASLAASGEPVDWLDEQLIRELHRVEALRDPAGRDDLPYGVEMADMEKWARARAEGK
jgi:hypothetical protein